MIKRATILVLCAMLTFPFFPPPQPVQAAIAQTATKTQASSLANPVTMAFDCNGGNLLVVGICTNNAERAGAVPTYNGVNMVASPQGSIFTGTEVAAEMFYLVSPAAGSNTISIPNTGTSNLVPIASAWSGVDVADPLDTSNSANDGNSTPATVTITTSAADKLIIDIAPDGETGGIPTANSHTLISSVDNGGWNSSSQYTLDDGSSGITLDWTLFAADDWAMIVCAFNPAGGAPPARRIFIID